MMPKFAASTAIVVLSVAATVHGFKFMAIGDWGASYEATKLDTCAGGVVPQQKADAVAMASYAAANKVNHVMLLGDNFYGSGIHGDCHNCRFQETFEQIYSGASLQDIPFYAIAGNHDHGGNVSAQIAYSGISSRWKYPDWYYSFTENFTDAGKTVTMDFFMIDTVLADSTGDGKYGAELLKEFPDVEYPPNAPTAAAQWAWLEAGLKASTADYVWVGGHYPVWSGCSHGPTASMVDHLKPMLENYHISGYMCGHDHCEEYIDEGKGPKYVLTGSGFECCYGATKVSSNPPGSIKMAYWDGDCPEGAHCPPKSPNSAFTVFDASATNMTVTFVDSAGVVLYQAPPIMPRTAAQKALFK